VEIHTMYSLRIGLLETHEVEEIDQRPWADHASDVDVARVVDPPPIRWAGLRVQRRCPHRRLRLAGLGQGFTSPAGHHCEDGIGE
jgi:hypothetical protein